MKKTNVIIASILGVLVIIIGLFLFMRPFVLKKYNNDLVKEEVTEEQKIKNEDEEESNNKDEKNIQLGINILYDGEGIDINEAENTVTINDEGTYNVTGNLTGGQIIVDTKKKVKLNFQGVNITNSNAVLDIKNTNEVIINLEGGTYNYFTGNTSVIKSSGNLKITGSGTLNVIASDGSAIDCADLTIENGNIYLNASQSPINTTRNYTLLGGLVLALGNSNLENISDSTTLTTIGFKLPQKITKNDSLALVNSMGNNIISINTTLDSDTIIIASASIINDNYNLIKDFGNTNEKIVIQNQDTFKVDKVINYFK